MRSQMETFSCDIILTDAIVKITAKPSLIESSRNNLLVRTMNSVVIGRDGFTDTVGGTKPNTTPLWEPSPLYNVSQWRPGKTACKLAPKTHLDHDVGSWPRAGFPRSPRLDFF